MADSTTHLDTISSSQSSKEVTANALFDVSSPSMVFGRRASTTAGLTWGYYGGCVNVGGTPTTIANGTVSLTASQTNYVQANSSGTVSVNTTGFTAGYKPLYQIVCGTATVTSYVDKRTDSVPLGSSVSENTLSTVIQAACSDESTALTAGNGKLVFRMPHDMTLTEVRASLTTASSSGAVTVDIIREGSPTTSLFSTKVTIDANERTSTTAATPAVLAYTELIDDEELTVNLDGAGTGATGLKITMIGTMPA